MVAGLGCRPSDKKGSHFGHSYEEVVKFWRGAFRVWGVLEGSGGPSK